MGPRGPVVCVGVEPICPVLTEHGIKIAPSTYYEHPGRSPPARARCGAEIRDHRVHAQNYGVYGARKVWLQLNREGIGCALHRGATDAELGPGRGGSRQVKRTTIADPAADRPADLVQRRFAPRRRTGCG